jgi:hypothetical protein
MKKLSFLLLLALAVTAVFSLSTAMVLSNNIAAQTNPGGKASGPVTLQSNKTYTRLTIDLRGGTGAGITGSGVSNVHITKCKIINGPAGIGILLNNCTNVTIDSCFFTTLGQGVLAKNCVSTKINYNQFLNIVGSATATWHPIQLQNCTGGGQQIIGNRIQEDPLIAPYTHDQISVFRSYGLPGDSIMVLNNWIRGAQQIKNAAGNNGACAIGVGDTGGAYQVVRGNIMVNALAIAIDGTGTSLKVDHNKIWATQQPPQPISVGIVYFGATGNNFVGYNWVNFTTPTGGKNNLNSNMAKGTIAGWNTNKVNASIDASILPATIITYK